MVNLHHICKADFVKFDFGESKHLLIDRRLAMKQLLVHVPLRVCVAKLKHMTYLKLIYSLLLVKRVTNMI